MFTAYGSARSVPSIASGAAGEKERISLHGLCSLDIRGAMKDVKAPRNREARGELPHHMPKERMSPRFNNHCHTSPYITIISRQRMSAYVILLTKSGKREYDGQ